MLEDFLTGANDWLAELSEDLSKRKGWMDGCKVNQSETCKNCNNQQ